MIELFAPARSLTALSSQLILYLPLSNRFLIIADCTSVHAFRGEDRNLRRVSCTSEFPLSLFRSSPKGFRGPQFSRGEPSEPLLQSSPLSDCSSNVILKRYQKLNRRRSKIILRMPRTFLIRFVTIPANFHNRQDPDYKQLCCSLVLVIFLIICLLSRF